VYMYVCPNVFLFYVKLRDLKQRYRLQDYIIVRILLFSVRQ
jgi:hypothetical protein